MTQQPFAQQPLAQPPVAPQPNPPQPNPQQPNPQQPNPQQTPPQASPPPSAAEMAFGLAGLAAAPPAASQPAAPPPDAPAFRWLDGGAKRVERYTLIFPFVLGGVEHRVIAVKRMTAGDVMAFTEKVRASPDETRRFPMYFVGDVSGAELSDAAWDAMDDDDRFALTEIAEAFLPARFRAAAAGSPASLDPPTGDTSASS